MHAPGCQEMHDRIEENCEKLGMAMNKAKTQILCITTAINYQVRSAIKIGDEVRKSQDTLKILGFTFGRRPTMHAHIETIRRKYAARSWSLIHLKRAGIPKAVLCQVFSSMIRPVIEYASVVYHSMLCEDLNEEIERFQRSALKIIYGFKVSYSDALRLSGLQRLEKRREKLMLDFALKAEKDSRYGKWFPPHPTYNHNIRKPMKYVEAFANRDRLKNSPVIYMRKMLNQFYAVPGNT